jgi:general secretion pathway protein G
MSGESRNGGDVLASIVLTVFVVLVLIGMIVPRLVTKEGGGRSQTRGDLATIRGLLEAFRIDTGRYPTTTEGLDALYEPPEGITGWQGPYASRPIRLDKWKRPYVYRATMTGDGPTFVLMSYGADGKDGGTGEDEDVSELRAPFSESH